MVIHNQVDWRTPEQALEWDTALVRGVFWHIHRQYDKETRVKLERQTRQDESRSTHDEQSDNQDDEEGGGGQHVQPSVVAFAFDEHRLTAKEDVLIGLKTTEHFLDKRPFLRSLVTILACCSNEKEMESVGSYVKYRLRERTISFAMVREKLREIYKKHVDLMQFEAKVEEFKAAARAKSTWCVRNPKSICKSPARFYGVHNIPPKPKSQKQIDEELQIVRSHSVAVANNAISLVLSQMIDAARPKSRGRSAKSGRRGGTPQTAGKSIASASEKAKQKRSQMQAIARRKELGLQVLVPGILHTRRSMDFGCLPTPSQEDDELLQRRVLHAKQLELLALMEATGDRAVAESLLQQLIPRSGFVRVVEHLANLGGTSVSGKPSLPPDEWEIFKLWKSVYRNRTIQSIQRLEQ